MCFTRVKQHILWGWICCLIDNEIINNKSCRSVLTGTFAESELLEEEVGTVEAKIMGPSEQLAEIL